MKVYENSIVWILNQNGISYNVNKDGTRTLIKGDVSCKLLKPNLKKIEEVFGELKHREKWY